MVSGSLDPKSSGANSEKKKVSLREKIVILSLRTKFAKKLYLVNYFLSRKEIVNIWGLLLCFITETEA